MDQITNDSIIILEFGESDRLTYVYKELEQFEYIIGLIRNPMHKIMVTISTNPPIYLIKLEYDISEGLTSEIFKIIYLYTQTNKFTGLTIDNVDTVLHFMDLYNINYTFNSDHCEYDLIIHLLNTSKNTNLLIKILVGLNNNFLHTNKGKIQLDNIANIFVNANQINEFNKAIKYHYYDILSGSLIWINTVSTLTSYTVLKKNVRMVTMDLFNIPKNTTSLHHPLTIATYISILGNNTTYNVSCYLYLGMPIKLRIIGFKNGTLVEEHIFNDAKDNIFVHFSDSITQLLLLAQ